jgi:hypothetical protein
VAGRFWFFLLRAEPREHNTLLLLSWQIIYLPLTPILSGALATSSLLLFLDVLPQLILVKGGWVFARFFCFRSLQCQILKLPTPLFLCFICRVAIVAALAIVPSELLEVTVGQVEVSAWDSRISAMLS